MNILEELRKNNGEFTFEEFLDNKCDFEESVKELRMNKEYELLYRVLSCYMKHYKEMISEPIMFYRPYADYNYNAVMLIEYAKLMEKGVKGIIEPNKEESDFAYLEILMRIFNYREDAEIFRPAIKHVNLLYKNAYPDLLDQYSHAIDTIGGYFYHKGEYKKAFRYYKKGADFNCDGRQIFWPYYLIARNQTHVGHMYFKGLGVEKDNKKARKYYRKAAKNAGLDHIPLEGDIYYEEEKYGEALLCYLSYKPHPRYDFGVFDTIHLEDKYDVIYEALSFKKPLTVKERTALALMYHFGLGCPQNENMYKQLIKKGDSELAEHMISKYQK